MYVANGLIQGDRSACCSTWATAIVLTKFLAAGGPSLGIGPRLEMLSSQAHLRNVCTHMKVKSEPRVEGLFVL